MKLLSILFRLKKSQEKIRDKKEALLLKTGREQFQQLVKRGIQVPVAYL
jgi:hypothetical protein